MAAPINIVSFAEIKSLLPYTYTAAELAAGVAIEINAHIAIAKQDAAKLIPASEV